MGKKKLILRNINIFPILNPWYIATLEQDKPRFNNNILEHRLLQLDKSLGQEKVYFK